jgi:[acyl-carrier-protein] S-malonyltransferase
MSPGSPNESAWQAMFECRPPEGPTAFVFPGQGSQGAAMLEAFQESPRFTEHVGRVGDLLGRDPLAIAVGDPEPLNRNAESSLLTVLASVLCLDLVRQAAPDLRPVALAGYSVGQWTALYAGDALSAADLFSVVHARARAMDACLGGAPSSGMLAVIGLPAAVIAGVCRDAADAGVQLELTNDNAPGQHTLGGTEAGLQFAEVRLRPLQPKRLVRVPVAGAWHSSLLANAVPEVHALLRRVSLRRPQLPIIDNTTGGWLPDDAHERREALARQVAHPVLWRQGIETLVATGVTTVLEVGFGDLLTKYGFFIDRSIRHLAAAPPARTRS